MTEQPKQMSMVIRDRYLISKWALISGEQQIISHFSNNARKGVVNYSEPFPGIRKAGN